MILVVFFLETGAYVAVGCEIGNLENGCEEAAKINQVH